MIPGCTFTFGSGCNTNILQPSLADYPKWPWIACTVQMLSQQCSCWQRFRERPWYPSAIWRGRPITKVLPTYLKSAVACGRSFACRNCDDSVLIIIKSTCMTGPLMGSLFSSHWKTGARLGGRPVLGGEEGGLGWDTHTCVCCTSCLFLQISS